MYKIVVNKHETTTRTKEHVFTTLLGRTGKFTGFSRKKISFRYRDGKRRTLREYNAKGVKKTKMGKEG